MSSRPAPYNYFTTYAAVQSALSQAPGGTDPVNVPAWSFLPPNTTDAQKGGFAGSVPASSITIPYRAGFGVSYTYDANSRSYARFNAGAREVDAANNEAIAAKNIVVILTDVHFTDEFGLDPAGNPKLDMQLLGTGTGIVFRDGLRQEPVGPVEHQRDPGLVAGARGVQLMVTGETRRFWIPEPLAYGGVDLTKPDVAAAVMQRARDTGGGFDALLNIASSQLELGDTAAARKTLDRGKIVASFCLGTKKLYKFVDNNPAFSFRPTEYVNDPNVISQQHKMTAINTALEIDLTGQVCSDSIGDKFYSGVGGAVDFNRGAAHAKDGKAIIAMPATAKGGAISRIVTRLFMLNRWMCRYASASVIPRDAVAGEGPGLLRTDAGDLGVVISFEVFFADRARAAVNAGGRVLLVPTNAASFTTSQVPAAELAAARLRAVEHGRQ